MNKNILVVTSALAMTACVVLSGCEKKQKDTYVDAYDYIGFMDKAEDGTQSRPSADYAALAVDGQFSKYRVLLEDGKPYLDIDGVKGYVDDRFYWEETSNTLYFTNASVTYTVKKDGTKLDCSDGSSEELGYSAMAFDDDNCYVSMELVDKFDDVDYTLYKSDSSNVPQTMRIGYASGEYKRAKATKENGLRTGADTSKAVIVKVKEGSTVTVLEEKDDWYKAQSEDGFVGYVDKKFYEDAFTDKVERENDDDTYTHNLMDGKVKLAWHQITAFGANDTFDDATKDMKGINVICPTWYSIIDTEGNIQNLASPAYVDWAHAKGLKVWALADDFGTADDGTKFVNKVIVTRDGRKNLIDNLVKAVVGCGADGLNLDYEYIGVNQGDSYRQFLRELSIECRKSNIVLSINNYVPSDWSSYYGMDQQRLLADYVVVMSYDEHTNASKESGPVASIPFVEKAMKDSVENVKDSSRVIMGIPFYTRVWKETPEQFVTDGSEIIEDSVNGNYALSSEAVSMDVAKSSYTAMNAEPVWNEETGCNFVYYEYNNTRYLMWLEDKDSIKRKIELANEYEVGGIACWKLTMENADVWPVIESFK